MTVEPRVEMVAAIDLSDYSEPVLYHAFDQAVRHDRPALHVVTVVPDKDQAEAEAKPLLVERVMAALDDAVPVERRATWTMLLHVLRGRPEEEITELAAELAAHLIIIGRFGRAAPGRKGLGSTADKVVRLADCPVLVVRAPRETSASDQQCPDCVEVRRSSDGEQWFCAAHHAERVGRVMVLSGAALVSPGRGSSMW